MHDPAALAALHAACFRTLPRPWSQAEIASLLSSPHVTLQAESGGFLIGRVVADEAEVLTLAVAPDLRRRGIGHRLLDGFLCTATLRAARCVFLEVAAGNHAALALYHKAGFTQTGRRKAYYKGPNGLQDDALILSRDLTPNV